MYKEKIMYNYIQQITGKTYAQIKHLYVSSFEEFLEIQEHLKTQNIDVIHILNRNDYPFSMPWENLTHMEHSGTTRLGIQTIFHFYANFDRLTVCWDLNIEKENNQRRFLQIDTKLVSDIIKLLSPYEKILDDFKNALLLVCIQLSNNKNSLCYDYQMQTEYFNEFTDNVINTI